MEIKKWFEKYYFWIFIPSIILSLILVGAYFTYIGIMDDEEIVVEGKIISVEYLGKSNYYLNGETFNITFDTGKSYIVECAEDIDFTVNSKMIIKLWRDDASCNWEIRRMYKVPSGD